MLFEPIYGTIDEHGATDLVEEACHRQGRNLWVTSVLKECQPNGVEICEFDRSPHERSIRDHELLVSKMLISNG